MAPGEHLEKPVCCNAPPSAVQMYWDARQRLGLSTNPHQLSRPASARDSQQLPDRTLVNAPALSDEKAVVHMLTRDGMESYAHGLQTQDRQRRVRVRTQSAGAGPARKLAATGTTCQHNSWVSPPPPHAQDASRTSICSSHSPQVAPELLAAAFRTGHSHQPLPWNNIQDMTKGDIAMSYTEARNAATTQQGGQTFHLDLQHSAQWLTAESADSHSMKPRANMQVEGSPRCSTSSLAPCSVQLRKAVSRSTTCKAVPATITEKPKPRLRDDRPAFLQHAAAELEHMHGWVQQREQDMTEGTEAPRHFLSSIVEHRIKFTHQQAEFMAHQREHLEKKIAEVEAVLQPKWLGVEFDLTARRRGPVVSSSPPAESTMTEAEMKERMRGLRRPSMFLYGMDVEQADAGEQLCSSSSSSRSDLHSSDWTASDASDKSEESEGEDEVGEPLVSQDLFVQDVMSGSESENWESDQGLPKGDVLGGDNDDGDLALTQSSGIIGPCSPMLGSDVAHDRPQSILSPPPELKLPRKARKPRHKLTWAAVDDAAAATGGTAGRAWEDDDDDDIRVERGKHLVIRNGVAVVEDAVHSPVSAAGASARLHQMDPEQQSQEQLANGHEVRQPISQLLLPQLTSTASVHDAGESFDPPQAGQDGCTPQAPRPPPRRTLSLAESLAESLRERKRPEEERSDLMDLGNYGITENKVDFLCVRLSITTWITKLHLQGNLLTDDSLARITRALVTPGAPLIAELDLSHNLEMTWRCGTWLAVMLGNHDIPDPQLQGIKPVKMRLRRLLLTGVELLDKGAMQIAEALKENTTLQELHASKCSIADHGGAALAAMLGDNSSLAYLDLSWNQMGRHTAQAAKPALKANVGLRRLLLSNNAFSDEDGAAILEGALEQEAWEVLDMGYNQLEVASCLLVCRMVRSYCTLQPAFGSTVQSALDTPRGTPTRQLCLDGNPLGFSGLRWLLKAMEAMAGLKASRPGAYRDDPLRVSINMCNFMLKENLLQIKRKTDSNGAATLYDAVDRKAVSAMQAAAEAAAAQKAKGKKGQADEGDRKGGRKSGAAKRASAADEPPAQPPKVVLANGKGLDPLFPAGQYELALDRASGRQILAELLELSGGLPKTPKGADVVSFSAIRMDGKMLKPDALRGLLDDPSKTGTLKFVVRSPAVLQVVDPAPMPANVLDWVCAALVQPRVRELWKVSVVDVLCSLYYLDPSQVARLLGAFDRQTGGDEMVSAAVSMYGRLIQPLDFWKEVAHLLQPRQLSDLKSRLDDLASVDVHNLTGRYMLNLSRTLDRSIAIRLQLASLQEARWHSNKFYINWRSGCIDGMPLLTSVLAQLQNYVVPNSGMLQVDYVSYQVPEPEQQHASPEDFAELLGKLRRLASSYQAGILQLQKEYLPGGKTRAEVQALKEARDYKLKASAQGVHSAMKLVLKTAAARKLKGQKAAGSDKPDGAKQAPGGQLPPASEKPPGLWWTESGLHVKALLRKYGALLPGEVAPAAGSRRSSISRSRRTSQTEGAGEAAAASQSRRASRSGDEGLNKDLAAAIERLDQRKPPPAAGKGKKGDKADKGASIVDLSRITPEEVAEQVLVRLLQAGTPNEAARVVQRVRDRHLVLLVRQMLALDPQGPGPRAVALLLDALPPLLALRFLHPTFDESQLLLPYRARMMVLSALRPEVAAVLEQAAEDLRVCAQRRSQELRLAIRQFASNHCISSEQLQRLIANVPKHDRCITFLTFWNKVVDRPGMIRAFLEMDRREQLQLMAHIGYANIIYTFGTLHGLHFRLNLLDPEQREVARHVVSKAVALQRGAAKGDGAGKKAMLKAQAGASADSDAGGSRPEAVTLQVLENLQLNDKPVVLPEDEKMWSTIIAGYELMECDFTPSLEQLQRRQLDVTAKAVRCGQVWLRRWRAARQARQLQEAALASKQAIPEEEEVEGEGAEAQGVIA